VVIEATPFVKGYDQDRVVEIPVVGQRVVGVRDKALAQPDVDRGWSSPDVPVPPLSKGGSTKQTFGNVPAAQASTNEVPLDSAAASPSAKGWKKASYLNVAPGSIAGLAHRAKKGMSR
jgi:hypothetical protein